MKRLDSAVRRSTIPLGGGERNSISGRILVLYYVSKSVRSLKRRRRRRRKTRYFSFYERSRGMIAFV